MHELPGPREPFKQDDASLTTEGTGGFYSQYESDTLFRTPRAECAI